MRILLIEEFDNAPVPQALRCENIAFDMVPPPDEDDELLPFDELPDDEDEDDELFGVVVFFVVSLGFSLKMILSFIRHIPIWIMLPEVSIIK